MKSDSDLFCVSFCSKTTLKILKTPTRPPLISAKISCQPLIPFASVWPWTTLCSSTRSPICPKKHASWPKMYCCLHLQLIFNSCNLEKKKGLSPPRVTLIDWSLFFFYSNLSQSFEEAMKEIDKSPAEQFKDSALILQLLRDNLGVSISHPIAHLTFISVAVYFAVCCAFCASATRPDVH